MGGLAGPEQGESGGVDVWGESPPAPAQRGVVQGALGCLLACLSLRGLVPQNGDRAHRLGRGVWELGQRAVLLTRNRWAFRKSQ